MRPAARHLPAFLTLIVPLVLLLAFGQHELARLGEQAEKALEEQSVHFLKAANLRLVEQVRGRCGALIDDVLKNDDALPQTARDLIERNPAVLDVFVLDLGSQMVFPYISPVSSITLPLHGQSASEITLAEVYEAAGDWEGARATLEGFLGGNPSAREAKMRAEFMLAGILRRTGATEAAQEAYSEARLDAIGLIANPNERLPHLDALALDLLSSVALAELAPDAGLRLQIMRNLADGHHDLVADEILGEVAARLLSGVPADAAERPELLDAYRTFRVLQSSRNFAREYQLLLVETVRRLTGSGQPGELKLELQSAGPNSTLLALRECRGDAQRGVAKRLRGAPLQGGVGWIGLRTNAALLLNDLMDPFLTPDVNGFSLAILDEAGDPVLPAKALAVDTSDTFKVHDFPTIADLRLRAIPVDPEAHLRSARAAARNRLLLLLALCLLAGGGAFFLVRSVSREAELASLKVLFVSRVSHELKTPLALIKMYGETLGLDRAQKAQVPRFGQIVSREADRLTQMIDRVLDFSRREAGSLRYAKERMDLSDLLLSVTDEYRPHVESLGARLSVTFENNLWVDADPEAMHNAVVNLIENAVKYTPASSADRTVELAASRAAEEIVLEVRDRGVGIPAAEREKVFSGFYRASTAGEVRGVGLGLSLVKHFAEAHGGSIKALPRDGGGTIMQLRLPCAAAPRDANDSPALPPPNR